ncbi:MAG: hypothetical protein F4150_03995 [Chloroflexi bacterium]|nr:hypothetical protein [Chloroflexota bacterium]
MRAIVYSRVSTDGQERDGSSLDTQERACLELAHERGWTVVRRIRDTASGSLLDRAGMDELRSALSRGEAGVVVAYAVDRLSRNQNHIGVLFDELERAEARLELVTERFEDTAVGRFILAARAFIAEVEREKIAERTMRGKEERARSGRIPQATGRGCFGYTYDPQSGRREIEPYQAAVVRRIFQRYAETRSFSAVASELNDAGIPAFAGGRWYPITIRRMLLNAAYVGRTVYRRTKRVRTRAAGARRRSRVVERPPQEQIEIPGATPAIVDAVLWDRVQELLADPVRVSRRPVARRRYVLRGRLRCGHCRGTMVGHTISPGTRVYHYYRCRHVYAGRGQKKCMGRYVPADALEQGIWSELLSVLSKPELVLRELHDEARAQVDPAEIARLEARIASLQKREEKLVNLYSYEGVDGDIVRRELEGLRRERTTLTDEFELLTCRAAALEPAVDEATLRTACDAIAQRLDGAGPDDQVRVLEALQISALVTREEVTVEAMLPIAPSDPLLDGKISGPLHEHGHDDVDEGVIPDRAEDAGARGR